MFNAAFRKRSQHQQIESLRDIRFSQSQAKVPSREFTGQDTIPKLSDNGDLVTVLVGPGRTPFKLSKYQLCKQSAYFATCLSSTWNKDNSKTEVHLADIDEDIFQLISRWLSEGRLQRNKPSDTDTELTRRPFWRKMVQLYLAADYLTMPTLMNEVVDADATEHRDHDFSSFQHTRRYGRVWTLPAFVEALQYEVAHTPYYSLMLDSCVYGLRHGSEKDQISLQQQLAYIQDLYPEVLVAFTMRSLRKGGSQNIFKDENPWYNDFSNYHIHTDGEKCGNLPGT